MYQAVESLTQKIWLMQPAYWKCVTINQENSTELKLFCKLNQNLEIHQ